MTVLHILSILVFIGLGSIGIAAMQDALSTILGDIRKKKTKSRSISDAKPQRPMTVIS